MRLYSEVTLLEYMIDFPHVRFCAAFSKLIDVRITF